MVKDHKTRMESARYYYYVPGKNERIWTRRYSAHHLPDQMTLYLYPGNPRKYVMEGTIQQGSSHPIYGLLLLVGFIAVLKVSYAILGIFFPT